MHTDIYFDERYLDNILKIKKEILLEFTQIKKFIEKIV